MMRDAYERTGRRPDAAAFEAQNAQDLRGLPVWELPRWRDRT